MSDLIVLHHDDIAGPSRFVEVLDSRAPIAAWRQVDVQAPGDLPDDPSGAAGLIVLGGRMSVTRPDEHEWMPAELELLSHAIAAQVPVLGVCLGAQLLAVALGGEVTRRSRPRAGFVALARTPDGSGDPVFGGWPDGAAPLFLHEDEVRTLPTGSRTMLDGADGTVAWRHGTAWAVQFHPEVDAPQLDGWVSGGLDRLLREAGVDGAQLVAEGHRRERFVVPLGQALLSRFLDGPVRERAANPR